MEGAIKHINIYQYLNVKLFNTYTLYLEFLVQTKEGQDYSSNVNRSINGTNSF